VSEFMASAFTIRLTHAEEARRREMRGMELTFTRFSEKASREYDLRTGSGTTSLLTAVSSLFLTSLLFLLSPGRVRAIRVRSFSLLVSHAYLEIIEGNKIKFLYSLYI